MSGELIVIVAVFLMVLPLYVGMGWLLGHRPVRRVSIAERELSPLGTRARVDETLAVEQVARSDRQESTEAWNAAGRPG